MNECPKCKGTEKEPMNNGEYQCKCGYFEDLREEKEREHNQFIDYFVKKDRQTQDELLHELQFIRNGEECDCEVHGI